MSFLTRFTSEVSKRGKLLLCLAASVPLYFLYIFGLTWNPPGFYIDEAAVSYNAWTIYLLGQGDSGHSWPLFFPVFPLGPVEFLGYADPVQIYILAAFYNIFSPSLLLPRAVSAGGIFVAAILLGVLARRISGRGVVGIIVAFSAMMTPWLFEMGRLAFAAALYPLTVALLLVAVYSAYRKERWSLLNNVLIALALALSTYTYAIGRLLGPLFALGLILFATDLKRLKDVIKTWVAYGITLLPMLVFHLRHPGALTGRFNMSVGYITPDMGYGEIFTEFIKHLIVNISPERLLLTGDPIPRHHVPEAAAILGITLVMGIIGVIIVAVKYRKDAWWRYVVFGLIASVIPASLTIEEFHSLRLSAFPIFLLVLTVPTLMWLVGGPGEKAGTASSLLQHFAARRTRSIALALVVVLTVVQIIFFQAHFWKIGPDRGGFFDYNFPAAFAAAIEQPERPIYLVDQHFYHALWQAAVQGVDPSNFVKLPPNGRPPANSIILSGESQCDDCEVIEQALPYIVYKTFISPPVPPVFHSNIGTEPGQFSKPQGIAVDGKGYYYVADTFNARVQKFEPDGKFVSLFSTNAEDETSQPSGIAVDLKGNVYVTDSLNHKLLEFASDGSFTHSWRGADSGFYGPRDVGFGSNKQLYIVDQGRTRIVRYDPETEISTAWGTGGAGEGEFNDSTGICVSGGFVFVTDVGNSRIQVFDLAGTFVSQWPVTQWEKSGGFNPDVAFDPETKLVYVSNAGAKEVLVFNIDGTFVETLKPADPAIPFNNPSSLAISKTAGVKRLYVVNTGSDIVATGDPSVSFIDIGTKTTPKPKASGK